MRRYNLKLFAIIIYFLPLIALWKLIGINQNSSILYNWSSPNQSVFIFFSCFLGILVYFIYKLLDSE
jgi:hypothetical protein